MTYPENPPYVGGPDEVVPTGGLSATGIAALAAISAQDWEDELYGAADTFLTPISELLGKLWNLFSEFVDLDGFIEIASDVLGFFYNLLDRAGFFDLLSGGVDLFGWLTELGVDAIEALIKPIVEVLKWAWELITGLIDVEGFQGFVERIVNALSPLFSATIFADLFTNVVKWFSDVFGGSGSQPDLLALVDKLPVVSTIVGVLTGKTQVDGLDLGLGTLNEWARKVEKDSKSSLDAITELGRRLLGGAFQAPPNGGADVNVLSQGDFATVETIDAADGWAWDNTTTASGSGGSAKLTATGTHRLYSKQSIPVVAGDVITMSGQIKTSGFTAGTGRLIALSVVPWNGASRILDNSGNPTSVQFTPRTTPASNWVTLSGSYTIPAGVTSIQARLAVTANSGAVIWFDDISIKKKSELDQGNVNNLVQAWRDIYYNATGTLSNVFWDAVGAAIGGVKFIVDNTAGGLQDTNLVLFGPGGEDGGTTIVTDNLPVEAIGDELGVALPSGSGGKLVRTSTSTVTAAAGANVFTSFYGSGTSSADITRSVSGGSFTVTHAGWYQCEVGFTVNAVPEFAGAFNVAPAVFIGSSATPEKIGATAFGSYGFGLGGYARTAHSTFIVYLDAGQAVKAGYYNYFSANDQFFSGGAANTYFSIAMLNRTAEG